MFLQRSTLGSDREVRKLAKQIMREHLLKVFVIVVLVFGMGMVSSVAVAQDAPPATGEIGEAGVIYQKKTIVNFGEDTIAGDLQLPDGEYIESRKRLRHSNLIRIRDNFRDKILRSVSSM